MTNYKDFFHRQNLLTIKDFYNYVQETIHYGWMDQRGTYHHDTNSANGYALQTPDELIRSQIGNCWDLTELYRCWFTNMTNLKIETYYILYDDNAGCPSHAILAYYDQNQVYWFEPLFADQDCDYSGIHSYTTIQELLTDLQNQFLQICLIRNIIPENYNRSNIKIFRYEQPPSHITGAEMRNHIENSQRIQL